MAHQVSWHSNIQTWMWLTSHSYGFYDKFYFMPINPFIHFPWHNADRIDFFQVIFLCFWFLPHSFQSFHKSLRSPLKNRALPRSSSTSNNSSSSRLSSSRLSSRPLQSLSKTSPGWVLTGCNLNEVRTRCKRGPNEVRNQILGDWPPKSPDILFGSHTLSHSFQDSKTQELSAVEQKRKPSQAAAAGKSKRRQKRRQRASKGDRGETKGPW